MQDHTAFAELQGLVQHLRGPEGCPWDQSQTLESMRSTLLEEAWEVIEAIEEKQPQHLQEELGDLLLNILLLSDIAQSKGFFSFESICTELSAKLVRRHPHVFHEAKAANAQEALASWEASKAREQETASSKASGTVSSKDLLCSVKEGGPALLFALDLQKKAAKLGFDWPAETASRGISQKIQEEMEELLAAGTEEREEELGDLLFSVVNLGRYYQLNPELALGRSSRKFRRRFLLACQYLEEQGIALEDASFEQLEAAWLQVKQGEKKLRNLEHDQRKNPTAKT